MSVSVIIPCLNAAETIQLQIESLLDQSVTRIKEIIISDNGSTDDTKKIVEAIAQNTESASIKYVDSSQIKNANYARNVGINSSTSDYLFFCDADDVVGYFWIENGLDLLKENSIWSGSAHNIFDYQYPSDLKAVRELIADEDIKSRAYSSQTGEFQVLMGGNFGITRVLMEKVGGFDVSAPSQSDDDDFGMRIRKLGYPIPVAKHAVIAYRIRSANVDRKTRMFNGAMSHAWLCTRHNLFPHSFYGNPLINFFKVNIVLPIFFKVTKKDQWEALKNRQTISRGYLKGFLKYSLLKNDSTPKIGLGWKNNNISD